MTLKAKATNPNISLFIDNLNGVEYAHDMGADHIEIHTAKFSKAIQNNDTTVLNEIQSIVDSAINMNLKINAGHDLNLKNLHYLVEMGNINEVSIGHAIIIDSLLYGFEETISKYLKIIRK
jgi:pyridoxine 5-phosphate synthase